MSTNVFFASSVLLMCSGLVPNRDSHFITGLMSKKKRHNNFRKEELNQSLSFCRQVHIPLGCCTNLLHTCSWVAHSPRSRFFSPIDVT